MEHQSSRRARHRGRTLVERHQGARLHARQPGAPRGHRQEQVQGRRALRQAAAGADPAAGPRRRGLLPQRQGAGAERQVITPPSRRLEHLRNGGVYRDARGDDTADDAPDQGSLDVILIDREGPTEAVPSAVQDDVFANLRQPQEQAGGGVEGHAKVIERVARRSDLLPHAVTAVPGRRSEARERDLGAIAVPLREAVVDHGAVGGPRSAFGHELHPPESDDTVVGAGVVRDQRARRLGAGLGRPRLREDDPRVRRAPGHAVGRSCGHERRSQKNDGEGAADRDARRPRVACFLLADESPARSDLSMHIGRDRCLRSDLMFF